MDNKNGGIKFQATPQGKVCGNTMSGNTNGNSAGDFGLKFDPTKSCDNFTRKLFFGVRNNDVKSLQEFLAKDASLYPEGLITGYFGLLTKKAVQRFQCKHGII